MKVFNHCLILSLCVIIVTSSNSYRKKEDDKEIKNIPNTLLSVTLFFRHGDRVTEQMTNYPTNPYQNHSYYPYGLGDLTNEGVKRIFNKGLHLQRRYKSFLGERYTPELISSTSSSYIRCQMSLQALHAGLFWTNKYNAIKEFPWQPVPYEVLQPQNDYISIIKSCPSILTNLQYPELSPETLKLFKYLQQHSGYNKIGYMQALTIYDNTKTNSELGLQPPNWMKKIYPEPLKSYAMTTWKMLADQKLRFGAGPLLAKVIEHAELIRQQLSKTKVVVFACHDLTIHYLLNALGNWRNETVEYGALLLFELHNIDNILGFKVYYENNNDETQKTNKQIKPIVIPNCGQFCPLDQFIGLVEDLYNPIPLCSD